MGRVAYHVEGLDRWPASDEARLASWDGHLGRVSGRTFEDVTTKTFYYAALKTLWDIQPTALEYAKATDALTRKVLGYDSGYHAGFMSLDENGDGIVDDDETGRDGMRDCLGAIAGIWGHLVGKSRSGQGAFFDASREIKFTSRAWNLDTSTGSEIRVDATNVFANTMAVYVGMSLAYGAAGTDPFFGIPYGLAVDGTPRWPSLPYGRFLYDMSNVYGKMYDNASAYAARTKQGFEMYVPDEGPYFQGASYNPEGRAGVVPISDRPHLPDGTPNPRYAPDYAIRVFTARFASGEAW